jgi:hypothetical protein
MNRIIPLTIVLTILARVVSLDMAKAQDNAFWNSYHAAQNGFNNGGYYAGNSRRNTEALINEMRAQRGAPPCSMGLIGPWKGGPAC